MYLRAYEESDFEALYALDRVCFAPRFRFSRALMQEVVEAPGAVVLLAMEESLLGFVAVQLAREDAAVWGYVATLDVAPEGRGRGLGRALMLAAQDEVRQAGAAAMLLHVSVENGAAVHLYEGLGYVRVGLEKGFYGQGWDAWVYRKGLG